MRLLLVGNSPATNINILAVFAGSAAIVTWCADSSQAIAELRTSGWKYDWVILESRGSIEEGGEILSAVEALGLRVPVGYLDAEGGAKPSLSLIYAAEKSADGVHFLRCALSSPGAVRIDMHNHGGEEIILEYHAQYNAEGDSSTPVLKIRRPATDPENTSGRFA